MIASAAEEHEPILSMLPGTGYVLAGGFRADGGRSADPGSGWRATSAFGPGAAAIRDSG